jgi:hypothetical protein
VALGGDHDAVGGLPGPATAVGGEAPAEAWSGVMDAERMVEIVTTQLNGQSGGGHGDKEEPRGKSMSRGRSKGAMIEQSAAARSARALADPS